MFVRKYYLIVLLLFVSFSPAISQSLRVSRFTEEEGLPSPLVKSIVRDKQGIVWAATDDGLVRFDGREFRLFQDELPGLYAKSVFCLPSGEMLVTTDMGISLFGDEAGKVNFETIGRGGLHQSDTLMWFPKMIFNDQAGNVWFSDNSKVYQYVDKRFRSYNLGSEVLTNNFNRSFSFSVDGMGHFYAFAEPGLVFRYEQKKDKLVPVILPAEITGIHAVFNVSKGVILIATSGGLYELKIGKDLTVISLRLVSKKDISYIARNSKGRIYAGTWAEGLFILTSGKNGAYQFDAVSQYPEKVVNHLYIDKEDNVWASTDVGILLLQETLFGSPFSHLTTSYIQSISRSASGDIYFTDGNQIFRSESGKLGMTFKVFQSVTAVLQVIPVTDGFWIADAEGRIMFCNNKGVRIKTFDFNDRGRAVFKLLIDHEENVWACQDANEDLIRISYDFHVEFYGIEKGLVSRPISLGMSAGGKIYCGGMTDSAYLFEYNPLKNQFENLSKRIDFERNIDLNINDIVCASDGSLWLGSSFGLISYRDGVFNRADLGKLSGNSVKAVAIDSLGYIWFANNKGLYRYLNGDKLLFDERNGLPSKNIAYRGLLIDANNRMWAGTLAGMAVSGELVKPRHTMMPIVRRFIVNNISQPFNPAVSTVVNNKSFISINVASPEYPSKQLSYEYFIEGEDSTWKSVPNDGVLLVGDLSPGEYKLKVRAHQTGNFTYSESLIWNLTITRIWYEKWWVIALLIIVPILVIRLLWQLNSRRLRSDNEKLEKLISERTQEIVLQSEHIEKQNARIIRKNDALSLKNKELELAKNLAEEATKAKSQFLSVMSHEIRTPMNAVIGVAHLLMRDNPRPDQLEDLKILKFSAENLLGLINDILDLNKIEAGKLVIESIDFNLKSLYNRKNELLPTLKRIVH
ncbi:MAG: histidine kinase dimerization/phospho-acceptor domain-containing protein [Lentimicrobium sp.]|jgi:ligand-binding sensor domain-containing protein|nr:histidine kinase dimerization/phospho-acceptor domain-containing protein [Lentimicrobium sp.]